MFQIAGGISSCDIADCGSINCRMGANHICSEGGHIGSPQRAPWPTPTLPVSGNVFGAGLAQAEFAKEVTDICNGIANMLIDKNRKYGDAALNPKPTFARCDAIEAINVRLDDKLSRIRNRQNDDDEDAEMDLLGYLVLKRVAMLRKQQASDALKEKIRRENK